VLFEWEDNVKDETERFKTAGNTDPAGRPTRGYGDSGGGSTAVRAEHDAPADSGQSENTKNVDTEGADPKNGKEE
jgi:hypothetical protein